MSAENTHTSTAELTAAESELDLEKPLSADSEILHKLTRFSLTVDQAIWMIRSTTRMPAVPPLR